MIVNTLVTKNSTGQHIASTSEITDSGMSQNLILYYYINPLFILFWTVFFCGGCSGIVMKFYSIAFYFGEENLRSSNRRVRWQRHLHIHLIFFAISSGLRCHFCYIFHFDGLHLASGQPLKPRKTWVLIPFKKEKHIFLWWVGVYLPPPNSHFPIQCNNDIRANSTRWRWPLVAILNIIGPPSTWIKFGGGTTVVIFTTIVPPR